MTARMLFIGCMMFTFACGGGGDAGPTKPATPQLTTIVVTISPSTIAVGQTATASAAGLDQNGAAYAINAVT